MIQIATASDTGAVRRLWDRCFPGDVPFAEWYFQRVYRPEHTLLLRQQGHLAAMTQRLPYQLNIDGTGRPVSYIYGACTAPEYRRQGLMRLLLEHSFRLDSQEGKVASTLIPQEPWLFDFYAQFGYRPAFYVDNRVYEAGPVDGEGTLARLTAADLSRLLAFYDSCPAMENAIAMTRERLALQLDEFENLGVGVFALERESRLVAIAYVWQLPKGLWAQEMLGDTRDTQRLARLILENTGKSALRCTGPAGADKTAQGCIRFHGKSLAWEGYMNLMYN